MSVASDQHCICSWECRVANYSKAFLAYSAIETIEQKLTGFVFSGCEAFSLQPQSANCNETTATSVLARNGHAIPHCACPLRRAKRIRQSPEFPHSVKHFTLSDWWWRYHGAEPEGCIDADT
jgi:hypothetical protein